MAHSSARVVLVFVDGIGLAPAGADNPFSEASLLPEVLGGPLTEETRLLLAARSSDDAEVYLGALDATLGVDGLPQSATGQTTLFTGTNAAASLGHHVTAFPGARLQEILRTDSIFKKVVEEGASATFANAFSQRYFELVERRRLRYSASVWAVLAARLELRDMAQLRAGEALSWDITRDQLAARSSEPVETIEPHEAGRHLALLAARHHFSMFETFLTDLVGHGRTELSPQEIVGRLDGLLRGALRAMPAETTLVMTSDHGNFEDLSHRRHTRNPVPLLAIGRDARVFESARSLADVTPIVLSLIAGPSHGIDSGREVKRE